VSLACRIVIFVGDAREILRRWKKRRAFRITPDEE
jgi:hypothetical protein